MGNVCLVVVEKRPTPSEKPATSHCSSMSCHARAVSQWNFSFNIRCAFQRQVCVCMCVFVCFLWIGLPFPQGCSLGFSIFLSSGLFTTAPTLAALSFSSSQDSHSLAEKSKYVFLFAAVRHSLFLWSRHTPPADIPVYKSHSNYHRIEKLP